MYTVKFAYITPEMKGIWDGPAWGQVSSLELLHFRPEGSGHRPQTSAKLLYNRDGIFGIFLVRDRHVRCRHTRYMDPVYRDSCVELFIRPKADRGYFNFEFNCGGTMLCSYITNPERTGAGFREYTPLPQDHGEMVSIFHSMPDRTEPEIEGPVTWTVEYFIPFGLLAKYLGETGALPGRSWKANFYKCGDETSHPHWASWQPVDSLNFHRPDCFGTIIFEDIAGPAGQ